jgi:hypothetical protein
MFMHVSNTPMLNELNLRAVFAREIDVARKKWLRGEGSFAVNAHGSDALRGIAAYQRRAD